MCHRHQRQPSCEAPSCAGCPASAQFSVCKQNSTQLKQHTLLVNSCTLLYATTHKNMNYKLAVQAWKMFAAWSSGQIKSKSSLFKHCPRIIPSLLGFKSYRTWLTNNYCCILYGTKLAVMAYKSYPTTCLFGH